MRLIISARFVGLIQLQPGAEKKKSRSVPLCEQYIRAQTVFPANECIWIHPISLGLLTWIPNSRRDDHPSLKEPILNAPLAHQHGTYWHCFSIKSALMAVCWFTLPAVERYTDYETFSARAVWHLGKRTRGGVARGDQWRSELRVKRQARARRWVWFVAVINPPAFELVTIVRDVF